MEPKKNYTIAVIPGDGTGPEVVQEAVKANTVTERDFELRLVYFDLGEESGFGEVLPSGVIEELKTYDAIFLGAIGHPK